MSQGQGENPDEQQQPRIKVAEQILHKLSVTVVNAEIFKDESEFQKVFYKPLEKWTEKDPREREDRTIKKDFQLHSYVKVFFGSEKERIQAIKYKKLLEQRKKEDDAIKEKEKKEIYSRTHISSTLKTSLNYSNVLNQSMVREQKLLAEPQPAEGEEGEPQEQKKEKEENPHIKETQISEGHLNPEWGETFEFERNTENFFTIVLYEADQNKDYYKREKYQGDKVLGQAKVDFSAFVKKQKDMEKAPKVVRLKNQEGEEIGEINIELEYKDSKKPENYDQLKEKSKTSNYLQIKFSAIAPTMTADLAKFAEMSSYCVVRINQEKLKTGLSPAGSFSWTDELLFKEVDPLQKKIYFEIVMFDEQTKFKEAVGIGAVDMKTLEQGEGLSLEKPTVLSYKGKPSGTITFSYDCVDKSSLTLKDKPVPVDFKTLKPSQKQLDTQLKLEQRHEQMSQKFYKFQAPQPMVYSTPQYVAIKPQTKVFKNERYENWKKELNEPFKLPMIKLKDGTVKEPIHSVMEIKMVDDPVYKNCITGTGFSRWNSATSLRCSVPHYSLSKQERFEIINPDKLPPGPGEYGRIGILEKMEILDKKLENRRKKHYEQVKALTKENN